MRVLLLLLGIFAVPCFAQTAESYRQQAIEKSRQKSWDQAIANFHKALELEPNDALTHYNLALALKYKGDAPKAIEEFKAALQLKPKWADAHYGLGATWYDLHEQESAVKELRIAITLEPDKATAHRLLAHIFLEQNAFLDARRELQRALAAKPSADLYSDLGITETQLGNLAAAAVNFRHAIQLNPKVAGTHVLLGVIFRRQEDHAVALAEFRKA